MAASNGQSARDANATRNNPPHDNPADALVVVGRVGGAYGLKGWIRVEPFSDDPSQSALLHAREWFLRTRTSPSQPASAAQAAAVAARPVRVTGCRISAGGLRAGIEGLDSPEQADALRGAEVLLPRSAFPRTEDDEYYWVDLIGCRVFSVDDEPLGTVTALDDHGAHPILRLQDEDGRIRLIPFVEALIPQVDVQARRIVADWDPSY